MLLRTWELPPHARRILVRCLHVLGKLGTTSACAENTDAEAACAHMPGNYLRVCGEYPDTSDPGAPLGELPPRARRILGGEVRGLTNQGTTSACAENTSPHAGFGTGSGNYLRVRGEYPTAPHCRRRLSELPPRARRIPVCLVIATGWSGTTSACAENTLRAFSMTARNWNYLRVRGEYMWSSTRAGIFLELPPRARRIQV